MIRPVDSSSSRPIPPKPLNITYAVWDKDRKRWMTPDLHEKDLEALVAIIDRLRNYESLNKSFKEGETLEITEKGIFVKDKKSSRKKYVDLLSDKGLSSSKKTYQAITSYAVQLLGTYSEGVTHKKLETEETDSKILSTLSGKEKAVIEVKIGADKRSPSMLIDNAKKQKGKTQENDTLVKLAGSTIKDDKLALPTRDEVNRLLLIGNYESRFEKFYSLLNEDSSLIKKLRSKGWNKKKFKQFDKWEREFAKTIRPLHEQLFYIQTADFYSVETYTRQRQLRRLAMKTIPKLNKLGKSFKKMGGSRKLIELQRTVAGLNPNVDIPVKDLISVINSRAEWTNQLYDDIGLHMNWRFNELKKRLLKEPLGPILSGVSKKELSKLLTLTSRFMRSYEPIYLAQKRFSNDDKNVVLQKYLYKILTQNAKKVRKNLDLLDKSLDKEGAQLSNALDSLLQKVDKKDPLYGHIKRTQELFGNVRAKRQQFLDITQ